MTQAYALDLREHVRAAVDRGMPRPQIAHDFDLRTRTRWLAQRRDTGPVAPGNAPTGEPAPASASAPPALAAGHRRARLDPRHKRLSATARNEAVRAAWGEAAAAAFASSDGVVSDERGTHSAHTRSYAYAPSNERATGRVPTKRGTVTTLIASLTPGGMGP